MSEDFDFAKELSEVSDPQALRFIERLICHFNTRIQKLEEEVAILKKDSNTSSKPPSFTKP